MRPIIQNDISLAPLNTFGLAARARYLVEVESVAALSALRAQAIWRDERRLVLGGGSNVVFTRDFDGLVVRIANKGLRHLGDDGDSHLVEAAAGENWDAVVRETVRNGWPGLENLALIPGSVGAAPVQNIGAYGVELAERFAWLDAFDTDSGRIARMDSSACAFGYRDSVFKHALAGRTVIVSVAFRLPVAWTARRGYADVEERLSESGIARPTPQQMVDIVTAIRRDKLPDPSSIGNAGSFFKNPVVETSTFDMLRATEPGIVGYPEPDGRTKIAAGWLIDRCGWRGRSLPGSDGRAAVHDRQALVLVNRGGATGADVMALASAIRASVLDRFAIGLEIEPLVV
jgi:UDP-N-acetylmuramate dehydrogenase